MKNKTYGYCRISTPKQNIERQERNIREKYPAAILVKEAYTGRSMDRPEWSRLCSRLRAGDTVIFDSVSRMSRNADEGVKEYFELLDKGVKLIYLKEPYIDTEVYAENIKDRIELTGADEDEIFKGINAYFRKLAIRQIRIAFEQSEKEVQDLRQRTREGIETARLHGKQIGGVTGTKYKVKKKEKALERIKQLSRDFGGQFKDSEVMEMVKLSRNTYYKYKKEVVDL